MKSRYSTSLLILLAATVPPIATLLGASLFFGREAPAITSDAQPVSRENDKLYLDGYTIFSIRCAICHSTIGRTDGRGPSLSNIGATAGTRRPPMSSHAYLLESILDPDAFIAPGASKGMPPMVAAGLNQDEIVSLVYYLSCLGGNPSESEIRALPIKPLPAVEKKREPVRREQIELGEEVFGNKARCVVCHPLSGRQGQDLLAPSILGIGALDDAQILESIVDPNKKISNGYDQAVIRWDDGRIESGRLLYRSDAEVVMVVPKDGGGAPIRIPMGQPDSPQVQVLKTSVMPANYGELLSAEELDALMAFLKTLISPD